MKVFIGVLILFFIGCEAPVDERSTEFRLAYIKANYTKKEVRIPMRDSVKLFATIYIPKDQSESYPFLIKRSPYGSGPYEAGEYRTNLGPRGDNRFMKEKYIFVYQDVRGRWMSEGKFLNMTPTCPHGDATDGCVDESTDTYDTVEWLLKNITPNNGKVGLFGISYPGFYAAASIVNSHPAITASSPQAPIADWFIGDDFHHNGAFFLQDAFRFFAGFEHAEPNPTQTRGQRVDPGMDDAYNFFLKMGPLKNANEKYFKNRVAFWDSMMTHPNYDHFWQRRNIIPHLKGVKANVMTVGGFFDAEDPYGAVEIYKEIEKNSPNVMNMLVMGPWFHGGWVRSSGSYMGNVNFEKATSSMYQSELDLPFFNYYLKGKGEFKQPDVKAFSTGSNKWHDFNRWPPKNATNRPVYLAENGTLSMQAPTLNGKDSYISDPDNPVPYSQQITWRRSREYMVEDQRFAGMRSDVLEYQTDLLENDLTLVGPVTANLYVSTTGSDADFIVKIIDVFPDSTSEWQPSDEKYMDVPMSGYQMLVRFESMRAKYRNSFVTPEAMIPGKVTQVKFRIPDIFHTFKKGHRLMIQIQSSFFPLIDRNPQTFVNIYEADETDFQKATHTIHRSQEHPSRIEFLQLN